MLSRNPVFVVLLALSSLNAACTPMVEKSANPGSQASAPSAQAATSTFHAFRVEGLDGTPHDLGDWRGKVVLVVNTASECGLTPQYAGLELLHAKLSGRGFAVIGFPSNDFGGQEPGTAAQIQEFCTSRYRVTFPLYAKVQVKPGANQAPLYAWLGTATGKLPGWNFGKYLIGKDGRAIAFFDSRMNPDDPALAAAIEQALAAG